LAFLLDPHDLGVADKYFNRELSQFIQLPGILQAQGFGDEISTNTPWVLSLYDRLWFEREDYQAHTQPGNVRVPFVSQPTRHYLGAAWYQRDIEIPKEWEGRRVVLFLERTRWETRAWLNDKLIGTNNSLCTPHEFDFGIVPPGKHRITVRVDNRMLLNYRPDAHAVSDSLGSTWNGIVGKD
jgi:beta-galactosidase